MSITLAADKIKALYQNGAVGEDEWAQALEDFNIELEAARDGAILEECVLKDKNWEISVSERVALLQKAKSLGVSSVAFLKDYYGFMGAHLDPGPEKDEAISELNLIMQSTMGAIQR